MENTRILSSEEALEERKKRGILLISIEDLYKDIARRSFLLGSRTPFPNGFMRVSKHELHSSTVEKLVRIEAHYKDLQNKLMTIQKEHWKMNCVWYWDTSKLEWNVKEFGRQLGRMVVGGVRKIGAGTKMERKG
ncbi:unnamed protein product [Caenorhabditis brenneri]